MPAKQIWPEVEKPTRERLSLAVSPGRQIFGDFADLIAFLFRLFSLKTRRGRPKDHRKIAIDSVGFQSLTTMIPAEVLKEYVQAVSGTHPVLKADFGVQYKDDGFVIVPNLIQPEDLDPLRLAADTVTERARSHEWKQVRVVGKQFPPWEKQDDVWGVQNIMHPELKQDIFRDWYGRHDMLQVCAALMDCELGDMQSGEEPFTVSSNADLIARTL